MAVYLCPFEDLTLGGIWDLKKKPISEGDIAQGVAYCGVLHVHDINWKKNLVHVDLFGNQTVSSATIDIYLVPFAETKKKKDEYNITDHRIMMEELKLWNRFEALKLRACDNEGKCRKDFQVENEAELFYGVTRKDNVWFGTSCTLNSWVKRARHTPQVVRDAGIKASDKSKDRLINLVPYSLWRETKV